MRLGHLGYAITAYRAQGSTVDTAHAVVASSAMTRESLYVAMTRGRSANHAYVATDQAVLEEHQRKPEGTVTAESVLFGILGHRGAEVSAHESIREEQEQWTNIAQLAAEYDTIAHTAQRDRWIGMLHRSGLHPAQVDDIIESETFGPLAAELRRAEANHHDPERLLRTVVAERPIRDEDDGAAMLRHRIQRATLAGRARNRKAPRLIAGLIPTADGVYDAQMQRALTERSQLIEQRSHALVDQALAGRERWLRDLGRLPGGRAEDVWKAHAAVVAAYRDKWRITSLHALGGQPESTNQRIDFARAQAAANRMKSLTNERRGTVRAADRSVGRTL